MFSGFIAVYKGSHMGTASGGVDKILLALGLITVAASVIWMVLKVRCPHCNKLLPLKLYNIDTCPYCGMNTKE